MEKRQKRNTSKKQRNKYYSEERTWVIGDQEPPEKTS